MEENSPAVVMDSVMDASTEPIRSQIAGLLPRLRRFALSLTGNTADADDLVQDTVERALRHLHQWHAGTRLDSWMFRIAQNLFIDERRARKRQNRVVVDTGGVAADASFDGARAAESKVTWTQTCTAMASLPEEQRSAVALVLIDGMSYRDAADVLGVPIGTLTSRLARGRDALAARIFGINTDARS
jgi:RNA polymerase sigma-70 factor (ECF subfamily)